MELKTPCVDKIALPKEMRDYILSQRKVNAKNGLNARESDLLSSKILQEKALDELNNIYNRIGMEDKYPDVINKEYKSNKKVSEDIVSASVNVAPLYSTKVENAKQANQLFNSSFYKEHKKRNEKVANAFGLEVTSQEDAIGGFDGKSEVSTIVNVSGKWEDIVDFAAVQGALTPEVQESTIASRFVEGGSKNHNVDRFDVGVSDTELAIKALRDTGFEEDGYTIDTQNGIVHLLDFSKREDAEFNEKYDTFTSKYELYGGEIKSEEVRAVESKYIKYGNVSEKEREYGYISRAESLSKIDGERLQQRYGGAGVRNELQTAKDRNEAFIAVKELKARDSYKEYQALRDKQLELDSEGKSLSPNDTKRIKELENELTDPLARIISSDEQEFANAKKEIEAIASDVSSLVSGGFKSEFGIKRPDRAAIKVVRWYNTEPTRLGDGARTNVIVNTNGDADFIFDTVSKIYGTESDRKEGLTTDLGYPKRLIEIRTSNGKIAEIQVMTPQGYLAKDGVKEFPKDAKSKALESLKEVRDRLGWNIPDGVGHLFYEINRDTNVPKELRDQAAEISRKYYDAFLNPESKLTEKEFRDDISEFKNKVDAADKSSWDKGNLGKSPESLNTFLGIKETASGGGSTGGIPPLTTQQKMNPKNPETVLSFEGLQEVADEHGLDPITARDQKKNAQTYQDAKDTISKWVKNGTYEKNVESLVNSSLMKRNITDEQAVILEQHIANVRNAADEAKAEFGIKSYEYDKSVLELKRVLRAGNYSLQSAGARLQMAQALGSKPNYGVSDMMAAKMESVGTDILTEKQKEDINEKSKNIKKLSDNADEKLASYQLKGAEYKAAEELRRQEKEIKASKNTPAKRAATKTENEFKAERQTLKEKLSKQWSQYKEASQKLGIASDGGAEGFMLTAKMAKTVGEIVKSHVEEVGSNLKEVVNRVYEEIKDIFPHVTENDIRDVIAGKYNEPQKTKTQLQIDLKDVQHEQKLINMLESLENGVVPVSENKKIERNQKIKELKDKIQELRKGIPVPDLKKLQDIKSKNEAKEKEIRMKIANKEFYKEKVNDYGDYERMKKLFPKEYKEAFDAEVAKNDAQHDFEVELLKDEQKNRSAGRKYVYDPIKDVIGTSKALRAGIDFSSMLIQNAVPLLSHPIDNAPAVIHSFRDMISASKFERDLAALHKSPYWDLIQRSGVDVTEPKSLAGKNKEEAFNRNILEKDIKIKSKRYNIGKYTTAPFERQFTSLGNHIRVSTFLRLAEKLEREGKTFATHPEEFKDIAKLVNTQTGRGTLPEFIQRSTETVNTFIWSPRLMAARLNLLGLGDLANPVFAGRKGFYSGLSPKIRKRALLDMVKFTGAVLSIYAAASYMFGAEPDLDPTSVTFGDLKEEDGNKSYNMFGGFSQYVKLAAIIAMNQRKMGNKKEKVWDDKGRSVADLLTKFMRGKVTPIAGVGINILDRKDYLGRKIDTKEQLESLVTPLSLSGFWDGLERDGAASAIANGLISMTGINVKDDRDYKKSNKK